MKFTPLTVTDAAWVAVTPVIDTKRIIVQENTDLSAAKAYLVAEVPNGTGIKKVGGSRFVFEMGDRPYRAGNPAGYLKLQSGGGSVEFYQYDGGM